MEEGDEVSGGRVPGTLKGTKAPALLLNVMALTGTAAAMIGAVLTLPVYTTAVFATGTPSGFQFAAVCHCALV